MKDQNGKYIKMALGMPCDCKTCRALLAGGVNDPEVAKKLGVRGPRAWYEFLKGHEEYHNARREAISDSLTVRAMSDEMLAKCTAPVPEAKPKPKAAPKLSDEALDRMLMERAAYTPKRLRNCRQDNRPVVKPLDVTPFAGW